MVRFVVKIQRKYLFVYRYGVQAWEGLPFIIYGQIRGQISRWESWKSRRFSDFICIFRRFRKSANGHELEKDFIKLRVAACGRMLREVSYFVGCRADGFLVIGSGMNATYRRIMFCYCSRPCRAPQQNAHKMAILSILALKPSGFL